MKSLQFISRYIYFFLQSIKRNSSKSTFVLNLLSVIQQSKNIENIDSIKIESLRKKLSKSNKKINIVDFGAGSNINNSQFRKISDVIKNSAKNKKFGRLLYKLVEEYHPKNILELGTSLGISTSYLASAKSNSKVITFEGCKETAKIAKQNFKYLNYSNIKLILGEFGETLHKELAHIKQVDLVFIDGNHQKEPTIHYFNSLLEYSNKTTIFIFDDIHWSAEMEDAWECIKMHKDVSCSIDLFFMGIILINNDLEKENLIIRF